MIGAECRFGLVLGNESRYFQRHTTKTLATGQKASWRSGDAADCKSVYTGSIPVLASNIFNGLAKGLLIGVSPQVSVSRSGLVLFVVTCALLRLGVRA